MTRNFIVLMNHDLTQRQLSEVNTVFGSMKLIVPPEDIRSFWESIPPEGELNMAGLNRVIKFLENIAGTGDVVLVQGEFGATFYVVDYCFKKGHIPVYATSVREYGEKRNDDGSINRCHVFKHVQFRRYSRFVEG